MPTGYTAIIEERDDVTFEEFVWRCARAFGALVELRDESLDAKIPKHFEPGDHNQKKAAEARALLAKLEKMAPEEAERAAAANYEKALKSWRESKSTTDAQNTRYREMIAKAQAWMPPTPEHEGLKRFMLEQLEMSLHAYEWPAPKPIRGPAWLAEQKELAKKNLDYHTKSQREEVERTEERNRWIRALRESVPPPLAARGK